MGTPASREGLHSIARSPPAPSRDGTVDVRKCVRVCVTLGAPDRRARLLDLLRARPRTRVFNRTGRGRAPLAASLCSPVSWLRSTRDS